MELRPGTYFELDGKGVEYVGVRQNHSKSSTQDIVLRLNPTQSDQALHAVFSLDEIEQKGTNFLNIGENLKYPELARQYENRVKALRDTNILNISPSGLEGVESGDGKFFPLPTLQEVKDLFIANQELLRLKSEQGFTRLQLTPLALPLNVLQVRVEHSLQKHFMEGKLFYSKRNPTDAYTPITFQDFENDLMRWCAFTQSFETKQIIYFPTAFNPVQGGLTKEQVIVNPQICAIPGWSISLIEEDESLKKFGEGLTMGGRPQLENGHTAADYLETLKTEPYIGETGYTPEDFLIDVLGRLEETNRICRSHNLENVVKFTGAYLTDFDESVLSYGFWYNTYKKLQLVATSADEPNKWRGTKTAVRLNGKSFS